MSRESVRGLLMGGDDGQRPSFSGYLEWSRSTLGVDWSDPKYRRFYESNVTNCLGFVQSHAFFQSIESTLKGISESYNSSNPEQLLTSGFGIKLLFKPFESVVNKSYRKNILRNERFPEPPEEGWCCPEHVFERFNDVIRSLLVCRYIDGPALVAEELDRCAKRLGIESVYESRQNEEGYYAYHFYAKVPSQINTMEWDSKAILLVVEIQITTQLQEVLKHLTHGFYEERRLDQYERSEAWKWQFDTPRFKGSYIGHALHLLEGVILALKNEVESRSHEGETDRV